MNAKVITARMNHYAARNLLNAIQYGSFEGLSNTQGSDEFRRQREVIASRPELFQAGTDLSEFNAEVARELRIVVAEIPEDGKTLRPCDVEPEDVKNIKGTFWVPDKSEPSLKAARVPDGTNTVFDKYGQYKAPGSVVISDGKGVLMEVSPPNQHDTHLVQRAWVDVIYISPM